MTLNLSSLTPAQQQAVLEGPALLPPPGVIPNFVDPPNQNILGYVLLSFCICITTIMVGIRLFAKIKRTKRMDIEDYLVVAALGVYAGFFYISYEIIELPGLYVHQWNVRLKDLSHILYNVNTNYILYGNIIMLLKAGILLEWARLFVPLGIHNSFWWTCHITLWINVMFYVACTIVENFSCTPREKIWNKIMTEGHCVNNPALIMSSGILNLVSDVLIFALPQKIIWGLRISMRKRIGVGLIFATGLFACVCGAFRLWSTIRALGADDITFLVGPIGLWSVGEITAAFLVLCVPSIPKAFQNSSLARIVTSFMASRRSNPGNSNSRRGLPSWYQARVSRRQRHTEISDLEEQVNVCVHSVRTESNAESTKLPNTGKDAWGVEEIRPAHIPKVHIHGIYR